MSTPRLVVVCGLVALIGVAPAIADQPVRETRNLHVVIADQHVEELARLVLRRGGTLSDIDAKMPIELPEAERVETVACFSSARDVLRSIVACVATLEVNGQRAPIITSVAIQPLGAKVAVLADSTEAVLRGMFQADPYLARRRARTEIDSREPSAKGAEITLTIRLDHEAPQECRIVPSLDDELGLRMVSASFRAAAIGGLQQEEGLDIARDDAFGIDRGSRIFGSEGRMNLQQLNVALYNLERRQTSVVTALSFRRAASQSDDGEFVLWDSLLVELSAVARKPVKSKDD